MKINSVYWLGLLLCVHIHAAAAVEPGDEALARVVFIAQTRTMQRVTVKPFLMDDETAKFCRPKDVSLKMIHAGNWCHIYVNEAGLKTMQSGEGEYPEGTVIVKQKYHDATLKDIELHTVMKKMRPGYDPEHGDWEYAVISGNAKKEYSRGRTDTCITCHAAYAKTDYVTRLYFSEQNGKK
jgi:Cytochrome P460